MDQRAQALQQIAAIARAHGLSATDVAAVIDSSSGGAGARRSQGVLVHVLGVLGGTFVFAGIGVFIALQWSDLNSAARVVVTLGSGLAAFVLAVLGTRDRRFEKAATPLFLAAAALEPTGILVAFEEFGSGGDWRWASLVMSGAMAAQFVLTFAALQRSTLLFLAILFGAVFSWTALDLMDADRTLIALVVGASMLLAAVGADRSGRGEITPFWYFAGASTFLYGFFDAVERTPLELSFLGMAAGFVYGSVLLHSRTLLAVATLAILAYTAWFTGEHFVDSIGWPLALVAFGLVLIGLSALAFRIDREYVRPKGSS
ncbi:MAG: DUF2157 domain-containing protein [Acidobacteria bacterium]|nr:DUF2157 domain-containing protein [Acidobacteriota bacterium]